MTKKLYFILILILLSSNVLGYRNALVGQGVDRYSTERNNIGFLNQDNIWTGINYFSNISLNVSQINFTETDPFFHAWNYDYYQLIGYPTDLANFTNSPGYIKVDTNETIRMNNIAGFSCTGDNKVSSFLLDSTPICTDDRDTKYTASGDLLDLNGTIFSVNELNLNTTIDLKLTEYNDSINIYNNNTYLRLDTNNDPLTGNLNIGNNNIINANQITANEFAGLLNYSYLDNYPTQCSGATPNVQGIGDILTCREDKNTQLSDNEVVEIVENNGFLKTSNRTMFQTNINTSQSHNRTISISHNFNINYYNNDNSIIHSELINLDSITINKTGIFDITYNINWENDSINDYNYLTYILKNDAKVDFTEFNHNKYPSATNLNFLLLLNKNDIIKVQSELICTIEKRQSIPDNEKINLLLINNTEDYSINNFDFTNGGVDFINNTAYFDGTNDNIYRNTNTLLYGDYNNFTLSMWVNPSSLSGTESRIFDSSQYAQDGIRVALTSTTILIKLQNPVTLDDVEQYNIVLNTSQWYFLTFVINDQGASNPAKVDYYIDGVLRHSDDFDVGARVLENNRKIYCGTTSGGSFDYNGYMSNILFYDYELSPTEIRNIYELERNNYNFCDTGLKSKSGYLSIKDI